MWYWFDPSTNEWKFVSECESLEEEYQGHLKGQRSGQRVYHCFGNGCSSVVNFNTMTTQCGSGRCVFRHWSRGIPHNHMTFNLKRKDDTIKG